MDQQPTPPISTTTHQDNKRKQVTSHDMEHDSSMKKVKLSFNSLSQVYTTEEFPTQYTPFVYSLHGNSVEFTEEELNLLNDLEGFELNDLSSISSESMDRLMFTNTTLNREESFNQILDVGHSQYKASLKSFINTQDLTFIIARGGSGIGKSRILSETFKILQQVEPTDIFSRTSMIYFNFTNGFPLKETDTKRDLDLISMISSRIIYSAFKSGGEFKKLPNISNDFFLYEILNIISKKLHQTFNIPIEIPIPLVIALDEYQHATRFLKNLNVRLLQCLGNYMKLYQKQQGLILFPIFGGIVMDSDIVKCQSTGYSFQLLSLPPLRPKDIEEIIKEEQLEEYYEKEFKEFWSLIGVIPRQLEWAIEIAKDLQNYTKLTMENRISKIHVEMNKKIGNIYAESIVSLSDTYSYLITLILSGYEYHETDLKYSKQVDKLVSEGRIYKFGNYIGLPPLLIEIFSQKNNIIPKSLLSNLYNINSEKCEKFGEICLKTLTCKLNYCFKFRKEENKLIGNVFRGAHIPIQLSKQILKSSIEQTNGIYFKYEIVSNIIDEIDCILSEQLVMKTTQNERGINGYLPPLNTDHHDSKVLFMIVNRFSHETNSKETNISPNELKEYYEKALITKEGYEVYIIMFTNRKVTTNVASSIELGFIPSTPQCACDRLILVSGDCFHDFFHPFISNILN